MADAQATSPGFSALDARARAFLAAAWGVLEAQHVVPPSVFHPHLAVGHDYFGSDLDRLPEYVVLTSAIRAGHARFGDDLALGKRSFPGPYAYSFLEACIAGLTIDRSDFSTSAAAVDRAVDDLVTAVATVERDVACCRVVSHLTTSTGEPLDVAGVTVTPASPQGTSRELLDLISQEIPGANGAYGREIPFIFATPESVVVSRSKGANPFAAAEVASNRIERFLMLLRLLHAGTSDSAFEVRGETLQVREHRPTLYEFRGNRMVGTATQLLRRESVLTLEDDARFEGLDQLIRRAERHQPGMAFTSFGLAVQKFLLSYHAHSWYEQVVDLATAFEAALSGTASADVTLRLCQRAATLLATDRDPAPAIFADVRSLYDLRSKLVHGGNLTERALRKKIYAVSTVPIDAMYGVAQAFLVDRLRDLVRRSLLARICLAAGHEPVWPLGTDDSVDASLADQATRESWRQAWWGSLDAIGAMNAAERARPAVDFLTTYTMVTLPSGQSSHAR